MESISPTDIKCTWKQLKEKKTDEYKAQPLTENPCLKESNRPIDLSADQTEEFFNYMINNLPNSALSLYGYLHSLQCNVLVFLF